MELKKTDILQNLQAVLFGDTIIWNITPKISGYWFHLIVGVFEAAIPGIYTVK